MFAAYLLLKAEYNLCEECESLTIQQAFQIAHIPEEKADELFF